MKKILLILLVFISLDSFAQIRVKENTFRKTKKTRAVKKEFIYSHDKDYALIKISTENIQNVLKPDFEFRTFDRLDIDKEVKKKTIEISLDENTESFVLSHPLYGNLEYVLPEKLSSRCIYEMAIVSDEDVLDTLRNVVTIVSYPVKANVFIDDEYKGSTPLTIEDLFTGKYDVRIEKADYISKDTAFFIARNDTLSLIDTLIHVTDYANGQFKLGMGYYNDSMSMQNYEKAMEYFQVAAEYGHIEAMYYIGDCYYWGRGVEQDYEQSIECYKKSATLGHSASQNVLAKCYYDGIGVEEDKSMAVKWYIKAAEQGVVDAQYILADCYYYGIGVNGD